MLSRLLNRFGLRPSRPPFTEYATLEDIYYCYRLFLGREPDSEGWQHWSRAIQAEPVPLNDLRIHFAESQEYKQGQRHASEPLLVKLDGFSLWARPNDVATGAQIIRKHHYEPHLTDALRALLQPGHTFLDLGANIGYFACLAASLVGPQGKVIAFEPNPHNCALLRQSVQANGFENVVLHEMGVADEAGEFVLDSVGSNGVMLPLNYEPEIERLRIRTVVLDEMLHDVPRVDVVKMDIEGAEMLALRGMARLIERDKPAICTEFSPFWLARISHTEPVAYLNALRSHGYTLTLLVGDTQQAAASNEQIMALYEQAGHHLDLLAIAETAPSATPPHRP